MKDIISARISRRAILALSGAVMAAKVTSAGATPHGITPTRPVATGAGKVRGTRSGGISTFKGIPFGAPTGGTARFRPASPAASWTGVRECTSFGPMAPQGSLGSIAGTSNAAFAAFLEEIFGKPDLTARQSEDCLYLNVYTPDASPVRKRPVMVWLHGGGFAIGTGGTDAYDGSALCRRGDVVVVTINHRLNALGYLYLGAYGSQFADSGNAGMLDIVLALQWVRENVAAFGGDPDNVTIFGESGGGEKASILMAMPAAHGLFHKAIVESGPVLRTVEKSEAEEIAARTLAALGLSPNDVSKLQTLDASAVIEAATKSQFNGGVRAQGLIPTTDGRSLPASPFDPAAPELSRDIPLIIGTNKDEATMFLGGDPLFGKHTADQARSKLDHMAPGAGAAMYDDYARMLPQAAPTYVLSAAVTDIMMRTNSIKEAERKSLQPAPVFMYRLDWETPVLGGALRSPHGLDLPMVFDHVASSRGLVGPGTEPQKVADRMSQAWVNFARSGDPSQAGLAWPAYNTADRKTMIFDATSHVVSDPDPERRLYWANK